MCRALVTLAAALALLPATGALGTSITADPPHDSVLGCKAIKQVITNLNAGRLTDPESVIGPTFYSDAFGEVDGKEEEAFLQALRNSEGKPDESPMRLHSVYTIHRHEDRPTYLVLLQREAWHETRQLDDDMMMPQEIPDPHYGVDTSYWLVKFDSNDITDFREAPEMFDLGDESSELTHCFQYP